MRPPTSLIDEAMGFRAVIGSPFQMPDGSMGQSRRDYEACIGVFSLALTHHPHRDMVRGRTQVTTRSADSTFVARRVLDLA